MIQKHTQCVIVLYFFKEEHGISADFSSDKWFKCIPNELLFSIFLKKGHGISAELSRNS